jgi:hypothetical protein
LLPDCAQKDLYVDIVEPLGHDAEKFDRDFTAKKDALYNRFTAEFISTFCRSDGAIDWPRLVRYVSENLQDE